MELQESFCAYPLPEIRMVFMHVWHECTEFPHNDPYSCSLVVIYVSSELSVVYVWNSLWNSTAVQQLQTHTSSKYPSALPIFGKGKDKGKNKP